MEVMWKVVWEIIETCIKTVVKTHDVLHWFRAGRGVSTAIVDIKIFH